MNNQINQYQQRLFNKLFATLPSVRKAKEFNKGSNLNFEINYFYYFKNKDFWFTRGEDGYKYVFLFGIKDKPVKNINWKDICLKIDFDKNIQFNDKCLGLFSIEQSEIHILINKKILKEKFSYINISDFKITNFKSFDNSMDLEVIDLGNLNNDFIDNIEKLVKSVAKVKSGNIVKYETLARSPKDVSSKHIKKDPNLCEICSKNKTDFKMDSRLNDLKNIKQELCGRCIEKIVVSEFYTKIAPLLKGNETKELDIAKEKFGNNQLFNIGLELLEKYDIIRYIGVKKLFYSIDRDSYLVKKFMKYSDKNNLLIDNIVQEEPKIENKPVEEEIIETLDGDATEKQMKIVIEAISNGKSRKEAAELANIPLYKIVHWYNEGKQGNKPEYILFYRQLSELENIYNEFNYKMRNVLNMLKKGRSISQIDHVTEDEIKDWIEKGKQNKLPYINFYEEYIALIKNQIEEYEIKEINRKIFLENFKSGKTKEESAENADIELSLICNWYSKGSENIEPYVEFYNKFSDFKKNKKPKIPKLVKTDSFGTKITIMQMNNILEYLAMGKSEDEAIRKANVSKSTYKYWMNRGKQEFGDLYVQFYNYINQIKYANFDDEEIGEDDIENILIDPDIYAPLPVEYEKTFNGLMNKTGIAWVNKAGNNWVYSKQVNGKMKKITDEDIYGLHSKVKGENQIWGIRDYNLAKEFIDIPDDFEIPSKPKIEETDPDIYAPLPLKYEKSFNSMNQTGIAWVNQIGNKLYYSKYVNGKNIRLSGENIYDLYNKVKKVKQIWGIRDYSKASQYITLPDDFEIPEKQEDEEIEVVDDNKINESIYAPLSPDHLSKFNPNPNNRTGIAWVNKVGNNWFYQRQKDGNIIRFHDSDIIKLHEKVINNNQIWGIIDIKKAKKVIETNSIEEKQVSKPQKVIKPILSDSKVTVNYIEKSINESEILIKGVIKNKDLINVLNRLDCFKENIKRIIITSLNKEADIFIELEINKYLLHTFEEKIEGLGWKINK